MLVIVAPLYVPLILSQGFDPIWYGVLYTITCQISYMTPPFVYNLFLMKAMAHINYSFCADDLSWPGTGNAVSADCLVAT